MTWMGSAILMKKMTWMVDAGRPRIKFIVFTIDSIYELWGSLTPFVLRRAGVGRAWLRRAHALLTHNFENFWKIFLFPKNYKMGGVNTKEVGSSSAPAYLADDAMAASGAQVSAYSNNINNNGLEVYGFSKVMRSSGAPNVSAGGKINRPDAMNDGSHQMAPGDSGISPQNPQHTFESGDTIPTVFRWQHGGDDVYVTGTFNNWQEQACRMHPSGHDFTFILDLPRGRHAYKFLVDGEWRFAPEQCKAADANGHIHNYIDLTDFKTHGESEKLRRSQIERLGSITGGIYSREIPPLFEYSGEPPPLPPHLRHIILNQRPSEDKRELSEPHVVTLNHLYCTAMKHGLMVLGTSSRYKRRFVTTVHYSVASLHYELS